MNIELPGSLPEGWYTSDPDEAKRLHAELQKELPPGHILYAKPVSVVAHRTGTDDILCRHLDDSSHFTVIHLTWIGKEETSDIHPRVENDGNFDSFLEYEAAFYGR